jgi:TPP-dependent pyruvate/acetoin dehydrogenase alpha subunit
MVRLLTSAESALITIAEPFELTGAASDAAHLFHEMARIRLFEEALLDAFSAGKLAGTTHTCIGQEANGVGVIGAVDRERDIVVSNHRCHGHYLAYGGPMDALAAEIWGKGTGVCGGRGGSQHLHWRNFYSNGIQGGFVPIGCGMAMAEKRRDGGGVVVICLGDGTVGEGAVYEALNMAALWQLPVLFLVENNRYAQTTPIGLAVAGSLVDRARPFGINTLHTESFDVALIREQAISVIDAVREASRPFWWVIDSYRLVPHSKGDDFRDPAEIAAYREHDPMLVHGARLSESERESIIDVTRDEVAAAIVAAEAAPSPLLRSRLARAS